MLLGLANAIPDGHLVVYLPHLLVHPDCHRLGIGRKLMTAMLQKCADFHQIMLTADGNSARFYEALGFAKAGSTVPIWIYARTDYPQQPRSERSNHSLDLLFRPRRPNSAPSRRLKSKSGHEESVDNDDARGSSLFSSYETQAVL